MGMGVVVGGFGNVACGVGSIVIPHSMFLWYRTSRSWIITRRLDTRQLTCCHRWLFFATQKRLWYLYLSIITKILN